MAERRRVNGRFAKIVDLPPAGGPSIVRSQGGLVRMQTKGLEELRAGLQGIPQRVHARMGETAKERASRIQARLQAETAGAYVKAATGRFSRGLRASATQTTGNGGRARTVIRVTMINYRESQFLTNLAGGGYFKSYPVEPYRIFAEGVEGARDLISFGRRTNSLRSGRRAIALIKRHGVGRLKVPRQTAFFESSRQPGRRRVETREIRDAIGPMGNDPKSAFFFYPLWVNHPGFARDVVSDVVLDEGGQYINDQTQAVKSAHLEDGLIGVSRDIRSLEPTVRRKSQED